MHDMYTAKKTSYTCCGNRTMIHNAKLDWDSQYRQSCVLAVMPGSSHCMACGWLGFHVRIPGVS